jgi:iron complex outermembrane receptor protein
MDFDTHSVEGSIRSRFSTGGITHQLTIGGTYQERFLRFFIAFADLPSVESSLNNIIAIPRPDFGPLDGLFFQKTKSDSFSLADTIGMFNDRVLVTAGIRRVNIRVDDSYDESRWTPSAGVVFRATSAFSVYANYVKGFAAGPTAPNTGVINPGEQFPPVENRQYELGAKWDIGGWLLSSALFEITIPNGIIVPRLNSDLGEFRVDGEQRNRGFELSVAGEPLPGLRLIGGLSITDAELTRTQGGAFDGNRPVSIARNVITLNAEYDFPKLPGLTATGRVLHNSGLPVDQANTQFINGYVRFDLGARYAFAGNLTARLNVENVFQERYFIGSFNAGLLALPAPRTLRFSLTADF